MNGYVAATPTGLELQAFMGLAANNADDAAVIASLVSGYETVIGPLQATNAMADIMFGSGPDCFTARLREAAKLITMRGSVRTVASFMVLASLDGECLYPTLAVSRSVMDELGQALRQDMIHTIDQIRMAGGDPVVVLGEEAYGQAQAIIQNGPAVKQHGAFAGAAVLPSVATIKDMFEIVSEQKSPPQT